MAMCLLDLPGELLVSVLTQLPAPSLAQVSQTHPLLRDLAKEEKVWVARARLDFGVELRVSEQFSPRQFYQAILHKFGPLLGIWQRTDLRYYSGLVKLNYIDQSVVLEAILPPPTVNGGAQTDLAFVGDTFRETLLVLRKDRKDEKVVLEKNFLYKLQPGKVSIFYENKELLMEEGNNVENQEQTILGIVQGFFGGHTRTINVGEVDGILKIENKFLGEGNFQEYKESEWNRIGADGEVIPYLFERKFKEQVKNNNSCWYRRYKDTFSPDVLIPTGLFIGDYSAHGVEFINVEPFVPDLPKSDVEKVTEKGSSTFKAGPQLRGVKVTGDPNVPFDKVTFEVDESRCLNMSVDDQSSIENINSFMEQPTYVDYQDGLSLPFKIPGYMHGTENLPPNLNSCKGRWSCKCQIAGDGYTTPRMIPGNLIVFSETLFAVIFMELHSLSVYRKVTSL